MRSGKEELEENQGTSVQTKACVQIETHVHKLTCIQTEVHVWEETHMQTASI
jgi:hypothetical protein